MSPEIKVKTFCDGCDLLRECRATIEKDKVKMLCEDCEDCGNGQ